MMIVDLPDNLARNLDADLFSSAFWSRRKRRRWQSFKSMAWLSTWRQFDESAWAVFYGGNSTGAK
jgi:hypothetical protein